MDEFLTPFTKENGILPRPRSVQRAAEWPTLCRRQGTEVSKVAIRYCLDHPYVSTTFVGMATRAEVRLNVELLKAKTDFLLLDQIETTIGPEANLSWPSGNSDHHV